MKSRSFALVTAAVALAAVSACNKDNTGSKGVPPAQSDKAAKAAGTKTIAVGLAPSSRFMAAAKATSLDQTLAGPGPYTVFVPDDAAFAAAPPGIFDGNPKSRSAAIGVLTNLMLPGTVLAADVNKLIDRGHGKGLLGTVSGGVLTATRDGSKIVLTDSGGHKATVTQADEQFSNGVVHHINALLLPGKNAPAAGADQKVPG